MPILWEHMKSWVLKECDEVCGNKMGRRSKEDTWWWKEKVKEAASIKKNAHNDMCWNSTLKNKSRYKKQAKKQFQKQ